jgi:hypothetical protein
MRKAIPFSGITRDAGANDILPRRKPAFIAWNDVIQIQVAFIEDLAAVLTGILVALEDVVPGKLHLFPRHAVEEHEHDHARHSDLERNGVHHLLFWRLDGEVAPALEVVREEVIVPVGKDDLGVPRTEQREGAPDGADVESPATDGSGRGLAVEHRRAGLRKVARKLAPGFWGVNATVIYHAGAGI